MVFKFAHPYILILLPLAALLIFLTFGRLQGLAPFRRRAALFLRLASLCLLILALAGPGIKKVSDSTTTVFVIDASDSTARERKAIDSRIKEALDNKKTEDRVGMVAFGNNALVELLPREKITYETIGSKPDSSFTNIEQALKLASSLIPAGDRKRLVLFSDGRENTGDALKQAKLLKQQGITLDVVPFAVNRTGEVQLKEIKLPDNLRRDEKFEVVVKIDSTVKTSGTLKLFADRQLAAERRVEIQKGSNGFVFVDTAAKEGLVTYSAVIDPDTDVSFRNNKLSAFSQVGDRAQVLIIQDEGEGASELVKMLDRDVEVNVKPPENLPVTIEGLQKYDAFIISDVSAERFDDRFLNSLESCIRHQGKGLLVTGGENSYAPGGYYKTVLETVLPVNMDIKPKKENPNLGLVLAIDKSGSMSMGQYGVSKVELAKEAAIRSTEVLRPEDMIGVIGFDSAVSWVVKTQKLTNLKKIQDAIGTLRADGGTQILPPLEEAYKSLKAADTKLKHIILLTDGQAERSGYEPIIDKIAKAGITLSTVAVGQEADWQLLQALAAGGKGRFYMTDEFSDIPKIFAKETFLAGKAYLNNRVFTPNLQSYSEVLKGLEAVPSLAGYVGTTAKSTARVVFSSDRDDPVLATWQYGLGRTAAWTPDAKGMWTGNWLQWKQSPVFWRNLVSWVLQRKNISEYDIKTSLASGKGRLELELPPEERKADEQITAVMVSPSGKEETVRLEPEAPGSYTGDFSGSEEGVYIANISIKAEGETIENIVSGVAVPYSPEYDIPEEGIPRFIERLAREGGGRVLEDAAEVFRGKLPEIVSVSDITPLLLQLVIILFFLDIAVRRVNPPMDKIRHTIAKAAAVFTASTAKVFGRSAQVHGGTGADNRASDSVSASPSAPAQPAASRYNTEGANGKVKTQASSGNADTQAGAAHKPVSGSNKQLKAREKQDGASGRLQGTGDTLVPSSDNKQKTGKTVPQKQKEQPRGDAHISSLLEKKRKRER